MPTRISRPPVMKILRVSLMLTVATLAHGTNNQNAVVPTWDGTPTTSRIPSEPEKLMNALPRPAPEWQVDQWFNTPAPLSLAALKGKVIVLEAFQMLCPGCVSHGLPQAQRIAASFGREKVAVVGLHTVFEHHAAMSPVSLQAFLHEYRINFPVGVDRPGNHSDIPQTMSAYGMRGTPTLSLIDGQGILRFQHFGQVSDILIGAQIAELVIEARSIDTAALAKIETTAHMCDENGCAIPAH